MWKFNCNSNYNPNSLQGQQQQPLIDYQYESEAAAANADDGLEDLNNIQISELVNVNNVLPQNVAFFPLQNANAFPAQNVNNVPPQNVNMVGMTQPQQSQDMRKPPAKRRLLSSKQNGVLCKMNIWDADKKDKTVIKNILCTAIGEKKFIILRCDSNATEEKRAPRRTELHRLYGKIIAELPKFKNEEYEEKVANEEKEEKKEQNKDVSKAKQHPVQVAIGKIFMEMVDSVRKSSKKCRNPNRWPWHAKFKGFYEKTKKSKNGGKAVNKETMGSTSTLEAPVPFKKAKKSSMSSHLNGMPILKCQVEQVPFPMAISTLQSTSTSTATQSEITTAIQMPPVNSTNVGAALPEAGRLSPCPQNVVANVEVEHPRAPQVISIVDEEVDSLASKFAIIVSMPKVPVSKAPSMVKVVYGDSKTMLYYSFDHYSMRNIAKVIGLLDEENNSNNSNYTCTQMQIDQSTGVPIRAHDVFEFLLECMKITGKIGAGIVIPEQHWGFNAHLISFRLY